MLDSYEMIKLNKNKNKNVYKQDHLGRDIAMEIF